MCLVDKNEKNMESDKKNSRDKIKTIENERCFECLIACKFKTTAPNDFKSGKYKIVINAAYDEENIYYTSSAKIKRWNNFL